MISKRMQDAIDFALEKHQGQLDKAGKPYFGHVLRVALSVLHYGEDYFITAILHDVVEDHHIPLSEIESRWGSEVAAAVDSVTRREMPVKETYMTLIHRASENKIGREVKLADLRDNMQPHRIECLPVEQRDIVNRYKRAEKYLVNIKHTIAQEKEIVLAEQRRKQAEAIYENGGGA